MWCFAGLALPSESLPLGTYVNKANILRACMYLRMRVAAFSCV